MFRVVAALSLCYMRAVTDENAQRLGLNPLEPPRDYSRWRRIAKSRISQGILAAQSIDSAVAIDPAFRRPAGW